MGLWDILVPAEPGVLHNTIANPSFEYDSGEISKIFGKYSPTRENLKYWNTTHGSVSISASTDWASQGKTSLKINKGVTAGASAGIQYNPRSSLFAAPTLVTSYASGVGGTISGVTNPTITMGVMPLTDVGMSLANGITDTQFHPDVSIALPLHAYLHPSIDSRRGHGALTYATLSLPASGSLQARVTILDNSTSRNNFPSGWAVWYSTNATLSGGLPTNGTFQLAGVFANQTSFMDGTLSFYSNTTQFTGTGTNFTQSDVGKVLYTTTGTVIGTIAAISTPTNGTFNPSFTPTFSGTNIEFRTTINIGINNIIASSAPTQVGTELLTIDPTSNITVNRSGLDFTSADIGKHIYVKSPNNMFVFVGTIQNAAASQQATLTAPAQYEPFNQLFWLSTETNPQSFPDNTQGSLRMYTVASSVFSPPEIKLDATAPYWGITNSSYGGFTKKHHLYLDWYLSADNSLNPNATYNNTGADWSVYLYDNITSTATLLGKLDSAGTTASAKRMGLRTKFLINRPSGNTSDMSIRILYTGTGSSDAALYIDGVQFVDVGMIWRAYDWYGTNIGTSTTPPQFSDWDWDTVEFSYVDGDTPGAMWSDTMPTQSGTYTASFPFFTNSGIWLRDFYEFETVSSSTNAGGYAGPRSRLNYQWRNSSSPVYGISVPGLSQSSMQTQTFTTGFWAPLDTSNINVVVEPQVSGVGMPEIATTSIEYGIVDGGYVQRQVARMRNFQLTVTISAQSWTGLHANRRSLINLLKFDQLSQQGERRIRYRGAGIPVFTSVTYQSGLEYSGTQGTSFTEGLALRFLSTDPYFYTETSVTTDASPEKYDLADFSHVLYKLGNDAEWMPLSHKYYTYDNNNNAIIGGKTYFYNSSDVNRSPRGIGWIQSPSGTISALIVTGEFVKPVPYVAIFYVSGYDGGLADNFSKVTVQPRYNSGNKLFVSGIGTLSFSIAGTYELTANDVGKYLFNNNGVLVGQINTVNPNNAGNTTGTFVSPAQAASNPASGWTLVVYSTSATETMPNNVHLHNLLSANESIYSIYQESANSVLVAGKVTTITDSLTAEPTSTGTTGYVASKVNETFPTYRNRVFRISMNDNGKITVQAVDDVFTKSWSPLGAPTSVTYTSSLYYLLFYNNDVQSIFAISRTPSNYTILATKGNNTSGSIVYDPLYASGAIDRSTSAFVNETVASSVLGIDPVGNAITIGMRTTVRGTGKITTSLTQPNTCYVVGSDNVSFTDDWIGRSLYTLDGLYVGKIYSVINETSLLLSEPATIYMRAQQYEVSVDTARIVSDNKSIRSSLYAIARYDDAKVYTNAKNKSLMYGYFNNPSLLGNVSIVSGSRSLGSTANIADAYGIAYSLSPVSTITFTNSSVSATVTNTKLNQSHVGSYVLFAATSANEYIGRIAEVLSETSFNFSSIPNTSAYGTVPFYLRSSRQLVDATGYTSLAGNLASWINEYVGVLDFSARTSSTNVIIPDFIVPSISPTGTSVTYKTPYIFSDTTSTNAFIMTQSNPINQILRRGVFADTYERNLYSTSIKYLTSGWGIVIGGNDTPLLTARSGTITTSTANTTITLGGSTFAATDVGRSVYTAAEVFLGVIATVTVGGISGTFLNKPTVGGTFSGPLTTSKWYPYQFNLQSRMSSAFFSGVAQGMTVGATAVAQGTATAFTVSFCSTAIVASVTNPCLYAYMNRMWYFVGVITNTTATQITIGAGTRVALTSRAALCIAPAMVVWSSSARKYATGDELYCLLGTSPSSDYVQTYMGTVSAVVTQTDNYAILAVLPYTYSQESTPTSNQWSVTSANTMVWVGAKQYRGSQKSNFFADVYGTGFTQTGDYTGMSFNKASAVSRDESTNFIMPGVLRGVISTSTTTTPTIVAGLNTSFSATASANNPMATGKYLYTFDGRLISPGTITAVGSTISLTLTSASTINATHMYYRIGTSSSFADGGVLSSSSTSQIVNFSSVAFTVNISSAVGSTITLTAATFIKDNWVGRAIYTSNTYDATTYIGIVASMTTTVITFATDLNVTPSTGSQTIYVASVPLKWTFRGGDVIRTTTSASSTTYGIAGALLGQVRDVLVPSNAIVLSSSAAINLTNKPFVVQRGVGISKGMGFLTQISSTQITGIETYFSTLPINNAIGACADIYIAPATGSTTVIASAANFTLVGQAYITTSDTVMQIRDSQVTFAGTVEYEWYYVLRNIPGSAVANDYMNETDFYTNTINTYITGTMLGLGSITGAASTSISIPGASTTNLWVLTGSNSIVASPGAAKTPTQFTYQVAPGDVIATFNSGGTFLNQPFRVVQVLSDYELVVTAINGNATFASTSLPWLYTIIKDTKEMVAFDQGVTGYTNTDWQKLGYANDAIYTLHTTFNGDIYAGGAFTQWVKQSSGNPDAASGDAVSFVNRMAKIVVGLNSYGYVLDAYGAPIAGNSYTRNGFFDGEVYSITDTSNINPVNGYVGSSDTILVGGSFTKTTDNVPISSGLSVLPSSSISNTMRQVVNSDVSVLNSSLTTANNAAQYIAVSNRLRNYNGLIATNVLDGINGPNIAIAYNQTVTINHTTTYKAVRVRGNASAYPIISIQYLTNSNLSVNASKSLYQLIQTVTGAKIEFVNNALLVYNGETVIIDLRLGRRTVTSNLRGNLANALNPSSNFVDFILLGANNSAGLSTQSYDDYRVNVIGVHGDYGLTVTITYVPRFWSFDTNNLFYGTTKAGL